MQDTASTIKKLVGRQIIQGNSAFNDKYTMCRDIRRVEFNLIQSLGVRIREYQSSVHGRENS